MPTEFHSHATVDELLRLAGISTENSAARRWLESALDAARGTLDPQLAATGVTPAPRPCPAKHNAPLEKIEQAGDQLIAAIKELRHHPYAHASFWRFAAFGPVYTNEFERPDIISTMTNVHDAARQARVNKIGRPRNFRKQQIVNLALAFCARFSPKPPSSDVNNFFPRFAERFFEHATRLSIDDKNQGIDRQVRAALRRLPLEKVRTKLLNKTYF